MPKKTNPPASSRRKADITRREAVKVAGVTTAAVAMAAGFPRIQKVRAANSTVQYGVIGTGGRGQYHLKHFKSVDGGKCVAICDIDDANLKKGLGEAPDNPAAVKDYRELLGRKDIDAVVIATPLYTHFPITRDALLAGKHTFCEKSLVFKADEVHALRQLSNDRPKQVMQVGLQRRYSEFYQTAKQMVEKGMIGDVTHVYAQWNRNPGWVYRKNNWRLDKTKSGGLTAELASHQVDVADWMFGHHPEFVVGVGGIDYHKDGRTVYDNIQLIFRYPKGQKMMYSSISTNKHLCMFGGTRTEFGEVIMGTQGTIEITVGTDNEPALGLWFYEPGPKVETAGKTKEKAAASSATLLSTGRGGRALPILLAKDQVSDQDGFLSKEMKFARRWLYSKGVMTPEETRNPVDIQLDAFLNSVRTGKRPLADLEVGLADSTAVILANLAMDEGRRVFFDEINKMGKKA
ncbi:MAG: Gfo/Idh/MocA family oxidoreductase [Candidatus Solibacter usitatus]|nr:Gfo/Idh/MocA family oxidoreductase [Candidatus Solibacter usitatus]